VSLVEAPYPLGLETVEVEEAYSGSAVADQETSFSTCIPEEDY